MIFYLKAPLTDRYINWTTLVFGLRLYMKVNSYKRDRGNREKVRGSIISIIKSVLYDCNLIVEPRVLKEKLLLEA